MIFPADIQKRPDVFERILWQVAFTDLQDSFSVGSNKAWFQLPSEMELHMIAIVIDRGRRVHFIDRRVLQATNTC